MMAAIGASEQGAKVTLLERNEKLGKKIYITGKGRCNVTNLCQKDEFQHHIVRNPRFLFSALSALSPSDMMDKLNAWGCPVMVERGNRVFPKSEKASDVTKALEGRMHELGVRIRLNSRCQSLLSENGRITGAVLESGERLAADAVILATGGLSYPTTGSTGDGLTMLGALGCSIIQGKPALSALTCQPGWATSLMGLSLRNVRVTLEVTAPKKKKLYQELGEMLFTHFGVSGPLILSASSYLTGLPLSDAALSLDLKPALKSEQLDARIQRDLAAAGKKQALTVLCGLYPSRLAECMATLSGIDPTMPACEISKTQRLRLIEHTKRLVLPIAGLRPIGEAIVTAGGLSTGELDPKTMAVKCVPGLYAAGETVDVDALTGGFNLHIAFSTGYLAGQSAATEA